MPGFIFPGSGVSSSHRNIYLHRATDICTERKGASLISPHLHAHDYRHNMKAFPLSSHVIKARLPYVGGTNITTVLNIWEASVIYNR